MGSTFGGSEAELAIRGNGKVSFRGRMPGMAILCQECQESFFMMSVFSLLFS